MKRFLILAGILLSAFCAHAQTIDFTGVSINTERVKKVYERKSFIIGTGTADIFSATGKETNVTGLFGIRYGMVWHFGFYVGAEMGVGGVPGKHDRYYEWDNTLLTGMRRDPRVNLVAGGIWRVTSAFNLYLGSGLSYGQTLVQTQSKTWLEYDRVFLSPIAELGAIFHISHFTLSVGGGYVPIREKGVRATVGLGYNF